MAQITAQNVKELREKTGAGMMDCKKALVAADGDMQTAIEHLRKAGIAKAEKKAGRAATEGRVVACLDSNAAALVEVLCETDFAAKNDAFVAYAEDVARRLAADTTATGDVSATLAEAEKPYLTELVLQIGENMQVRRAVRWGSDGSFGSYIHMGGRIGVLVEADGPVTDELLSDICMHIAAFNPTYVSPADISPEVIEKEREIAKAQVEGKPEAIIDKIVTGKINKWLTEVCLVNQPWLRDDKTTLTKLAPDVTIRRFVRWTVGEELA